MRLLGVPFVLVALSTRVAAAPAGDVITTAPAPTPTVNTHCPTITKTGTICPSCAVPMCIKLSTVSNPCDCPTAIPTVTVNLPCGSGCHIGCGTAYNIESSSCPVTQTPTETSAPRPPPHTRTSRRTTITKPTKTSKHTSSTTTSLATTTANSCVATVTVDAYPKKGCAYSCMNAFCIIDKYVTAPCGCDSVEVVTSTAILPCPTSPDCQQCQVGFPFTTNDCAAAATAAVAL